MTANETLKALRKAGKNMGVTRLYFYLSEFGIKPLGRRQRPQQYPDTTPEIILSKLGLAPVPTIKPTPVPTIRELKTVRSKARK